MPQCMVNPQFAVVAVPQTIPQVSKISEYVSDRSMGTLRQLKPELTCPILKNYQRNVSEDSYDFSILEKQKNSRSEKREVGAMMGEWESQADAPVLSKNLPLPFSQGRAQIPLVGSISLKSLETDSSCSIQSKAD